MPQPAYSSLDMLIPKAGPAQMNRRKSTKPVRAKKEAEKMIAPDPTWKGLNSMNLTIERGAISTR